MSITTAEHALEEMAERVRTLSAANAKLEGALREISNERYKNRETVTPDKAWDAFQRLNAHVCRLYDIAAAALSPASQAQDVLVPRELVNSVITALDEWVMSDSLYSELAPRLRALLAKGGGNG